MKYVLLYESADDVLEKVRPHAAEHRARWETFRSQGTLLMIGPFTNPTDGAMGIFTTREAAEEFAAGDPLVINGAVKSWRILIWVEAIVPE